MKQPWEKGCIDFKGALSPSKGDEVKAGKRVHAKGIRNMVWGIYFGVLSSKPLSFTQYPLQYVLQHCHRFWRHLASASGDSVGI